MLDVLVAISLAFYMCFVIWALAVAWLVMDRITHKPFHPRAQFLRRVLKWPALLGIYLMTGSQIIVSRTIDGPEIWIGGLFLIFWICFRNFGDHDDPPKKDKKPVRARVKQIGGRLVIVAETP